VIDGSAFVPGIIVFSIMFLVALVLCLGFGISICRGVLTERRRTEGEN
jgi:hypothetical protein